MMRRSNLNTFASGCESDPRMTRCIPWPLGQSPWELREPLRAPNPPIHVMVTPAISWQLNRKWSKADFRACKGCPLFLWFILPASLFPCHTVDLGFQWMTARSLCEWLNFLKGIVDFDDFLAGCWGPAMFLLTVITMSLSCFQVSGKNHQTLRHFFT